MNGIRYIEHFGFTFTLYTHVISILIVKYFLIFFLQCTLAVENDFAFLTYRYCTFTIYILGCKS